MIAIPIRFFNSYYDGSIYPGSGRFSGLENGANCQCFSYELLRYFGYIVPDIRSSDLWDDTTYSIKVDDPAPLDMFFFNKNDEPYGAHVGVYLGSRKVIHLSSDVGYPTVWDMLEFRNSKRYCVFVGAKRFIVNTSVW